ncbi:putative zinc finger protein [Orchesella cincta]|uniref:Putative zinc finger protein n=1 Tax=Orchesella cincta TaxID=48709 RepID=A0A1D2NKG7_ORCCI|nr:putative zinc finger protein [Orchesella cincta]
MKLNESNLADPLLLTGCALTPWGGGGPFGGQDLISTTTFPDEALLLPPNTNGGNGGGGSLLCKGLPQGSSPTGQTGVELDALIMVQSSDSFAELKPLPPFDYGPGSQLALQNDPHLPQMGSSANSPPNHLTSTTSNNAPNTLRHGASGGSTGSASSIGSSPPGNSFGSPLGGSPSSLFDVVSSSTSVPANIKSELTEYLLNSDIDDIAALIGNAIADSTVPNLGIELDQNGVTSSTIDPWTELDAWIESACQQQQANEVSSAGNGSSSVNGGNSNGNPNGRLGNGQGMLLDQDATIHTSEQHFLDGGSSTLQTLLAGDTFQGSNNNGGPPMYGQQEMKHSDFQPTSILQSRLQAPTSGPQSLRVNTNGPGTSPNQLPESTTAHFGLKVDPYTLDPGSPPFIDPITGEVAQRPHTTHVSPPAVVTSSMMGSMGSNRYRKSYKLSSKSSNNSSANNNSNNPNMNNGGYHHGGDANGFLAAFGSPTSSPFDPSNHGISDQNSSKLGMKTKRKSNKLPSSTGIGSPLDPCGKEKPIHRCTVCNRGFLNKSNIKVHLRTHTGEKPFKCDVCGKAFRQKAHLLKHIQIHKRIPRD